MSFVSVIITEHYISFATDGRFTSLTGQVIQEDYKKIKKLNDNLVVAFAGDSLECEASIKGLEELINHVPRNNIGFNIELISTLMKQIIRDKFGNSKVFLSIGGINMENALEVTVFSSISDDLHSFSPKGNNLNHFYFGNNMDVVKEKMVYEDFAKKVVKANTPENAFIVQKQINDLVASFDSTVNCNVMNRIIKK